MLLPLSSFADILLNSSTTTATVSVSTSVYVSGNGNLNISDIAGWLQSGKSVFVECTGTIYPQEDIVVNLSSTVRLTLKSNGRIWISDNVDITATGNALEVVLWSDAANAQSTNSTANADVIFGSTSSITTNGGLLTIGGGADNGANGGTASDGIPDGYSYRGNGDYGGVWIPSNVTLSSGGGDIQILGKAYGGTACGIYAQNQMLINSGTGKVSLEGSSTGNYGILLGYSGNVDYAITSANTGDTAISIIGSTTSSSHCGVTLSLGSTSGQSLIQSTGSNGGIYIEGTSTNSVGIKTNTTSGGIFSSHQFLSAGGYITIKSSGKFEATGYAYFGNRSNSTAVNGITPAVTASSANIRFIYDDQTFDRGGHFSTTGELSIEPYGTAFTYNGGTALFGGSFSGSDYSISPSGSPTRILQAYNGAMLIKNYASLSGFRIGKTSSTSDIVIDQAFSVGGSIGLYGGYIYINGNLTSTATGDIFIKSNSGGDNSIAFNSGKTILKSGGTGTLTLQGNGRVNVSGNITASSPAVLDVVIWSDYNNTNDGGSTLIGNITTNGGDVWMGGSSSASGSYSWNGLTVGDGPSVGSNNSNWNGLDLFGSISTDGGDILIWAGDGYSSGIDGIGNDGAGDIVNAGNGDITIIADYVHGSGVYAVSFRTTGHLTIAPNAGSFATSPFNWSGTLSSGNLDFWGDFEYCNIYSIASLTELTIGHYSGMLDGANPVEIGNTSNVTITTPLSISGPITIKGGTLAINGSTTANSNTVTLIASTSVTQTAALSASNLALQGAGTFTLTNTSNNVSVVAIGEASAKASTISYVDSDAFEIGTVGAQNGIQSSSTVDMASQSGNITLSKDIITTSTSTNAIKLRPDTTSSSGQVIVSGTPTLSTGTGGWIQIL